jgi:hypothetical protein
MPAGKQAGDYSPIIQLSPISNVNKVAVVGDIDITRKRSLPRFEYSKMEFWYTYFQR